MRAPLLTILLVSAAAQADERRIGLGSFDRLRVQGPLQVSVVAGPPGATVTGDRAAIDAVEVQQDGATLIVRNAPRRLVEGRRADAETPLTVALATPALAQVSVFGSAHVAAAGVRGTRADLSVTGPGEIAVAAADADAVIATVIGEGRIAVAGRTGRARLMIDGAGTIAADMLEAGDLTIRLDGPGSVLARARFTAGVTNSGLGTIDVAGSPKCTVAAPAGGAVRCGDAALR